MRHRNRRGKLGRKTAHRLMMLRSMATSLFDKERIKTTLPKAKQLRPFAERLITLARKQDLHSRRLTLEQIQDKKVVKKLFDDIAKRFDADHGGYIRIIPYRTRWGDGAQTAFIELKRALLPEKEEKPKKKKGASKQEAAAESSKEEKAGKKTSRKSEKEQETEE